MLYISIVRFRNDSPNWILAGDTTNCVRHFAQTGLADFIVFALTITAFLWHIKGFNVRQENLYLPRISSHDFPWSEFKLISILLPTQQKYWPGSVIDFHFSYCLNTVKDSAHKNSAIPSAKIDDAKKSWEKCKDLWLKYSWWISIELHKNSVFCVVSNQSFFKIHLKGTVSRDFLPLFWLIRFELGPMWTGKNSFLSFFVFAKMLDCKVWKSSVRIVNN